MEYLTKNKHLLWRAGFGPSAQSLTELEQQASGGLLAKLLNETGNFTPIDTIEPEIKELGKRTDAAGKPIVLTAAQRLRIREASKEGYRKINLAWLDQMVHSPNQLGEKMSLFWHGHFASRSINMFYQEQLVNLTRRYALSDFGSLLKAVSQSASMINFLNNNQNRKDSPNENFARELLELFTLGIGHYTEMDIKEAARAFTGWGVTVQGDFEFRRARHDHGSKIFLGRKGNFTGDDILSIVLEQERTAQFITAKIYRFFVHEDGDKEKIRWLAKRFYDNGYQLRELMLDIFGSDWFYAEKNMGSRIKSPVELLVGIRRMLPMEIQNEQVQILLQSLLGQLLLFPPNVAGWPGGRNWIDGSAVLLRLRIPDMISSGEIPDLEAGVNDDIAMGRQTALRGMAAFNADIDWQPLLNYFSQLNDSELADQLADILLPAIAGRKFTPNYSYLERESRGRLLRSAMIRLMSTPEYQLC